MLKALRAFAGGRLTRTRESSLIRTTTILAGIVAVLYFLRGVFIPLALAITLSLILSPAVGWVRKAHIRRVAAVIIVMFVAATIAAGVGYTILNQLVEVVNGLTAYRQNIDNKITALRSPNQGALSRAAENVKELGKELAPPKVPVESPSSRSRSGPLASPSGPVSVQIVEAPANDLAYLRAMAEPFIGPLAELSIVLVFTAFLLIEESDLRNRLLQLAGLGRLNQMTLALEDGTRRVSRYLMLQFVVNACFGVLCGIGLYLIGVPDAALWGTVAALLRIVPYIGSIVAGSLPLMLSLAVFDGWHSPLLVFALFATLEIVTANFLEPWLYGVHTGVSSLALLLTTVFWAALWGPAGLILSTPLTVCVVVLGRHIPHLSFLHIMLGDQPVLAPQAHLYQRLLAMDDQEARAVADQYRQDRSLLELYDAVVIPTLVLAEHDRHKGGLDGEREEFLYLSLREMVAEWSETIAETDTPATAPRAERVLCLAAHDDADAIAAVMLGQLLENSGCVTISLPVGPSAMNFLDVIKPGSGDIFFISAVPPFAFSHARKLIRDLRGRYPGAEIVLGMWGFAGETKQTLLRFQPAPPEKIVRSLSEALDYLGVRDKAADRVGMKVA